MRIIAEDPSLLCGLNIGQALTYGGAHRTDPRTELITVARPQNIAMMVIVTAATMANAAPGMGAASSGRISQHLALGPQAQSVE
ncbi:hypothetical protein EE36_14033 [Sulfitobacter sp. EE-36]|nr:hypothetical protein EE36_14033 [Sulfitobacter sp. EE-36]